MLTLYICLFLAEMKDILINSRIALFVANIERSRIFNVPSYYTTHLTARIRQKWAAITLLCLKAQSIFRALNSRFFCSAENDPHSISNKRKPFTSFKPLSYRYLTLYSYIKIILNQFDLRIAK